MRGRRSASSLASADDAVPGDIENTGRVRGGGETNLSNNESTVVGPLPEPTIDLVIDKRADRLRFFPGERVGFQLTITNLGPSRATGVRVRDVLPPGLELVSLSSSQGTCSGASCTIGTLRRDQVETVRVIAVAGLDTGGRSLRDVATVRGEQRDVNLRNNIDSAVVRILSLVDLVVTKVAAAPSMPAGSDIQFTVTVRNAGPSTARRVLLRDVVPAGLELVSLVPSQGTCAPPNCVLGRMARDDVAQILVTARSRPDQAGQTFVNTAIALPFLQLERTPADNVARASVTLTAAPPPQSDIAVVKTVETTTAVVGEPLRYRLTVTNNGPDAAEAVTVTETPGGAVAVVSAVPSQGTCAVAQPIRCDLGPLAVGATATIDVTTVPREPGPLDNAVTAIAPGTDPDPDDNGGEAEVDVESAPELSLTKRANRRVVLGGRLVVFTMVVRSSGLSAAQETVLCDRVPGRALRGPGGRRPAARQPGVLDHRHAGPGRVAPLPARHAGRARAPGDAGHEHRRGHRGRDRGAQGRGARADPAAPGASVPAGAGPGAGRAVGGALLAPFRLRCGEEVEDEAGVEAAVAGAGLDGELRVGQGLEQRERVRGVDLVVAVADHDEHRPGVAGQVGLGERRLLAVHAVELGLDDGEVPGPLRRDRAPVAEEELGRLLVELDRARASSRRGGRRRR